MSGSEGWNEDSEATDRADFDFDGWEREAVKRDLRTAGYDDNERQWTGDSRHGFHLYSQEELGLMIEDVKRALLDFTGEDVVACDQKLLLLRSLHNLETQYKEIAELDPETGQEREKRRRNINLKYFGFESVGYCAVVYHELATHFANFSRAEREVEALRLQGKTPTEMAKKLGKTQQAISKSLLSAQEKIRAAERLLGGPHHGLLFQLMHFADTQGFSEWGKNYLLERGVRPEQCHRCPTATVPQVLMPKAAPEKRCERCNNYCAAWRDSCPACGGALVSARREKRKRT